MSEKKEEKKKDDESSSDDKKKKKVGKVKNDIELDPEIKNDVVSEAPLTIQQRIKRGRVMKRNKVRIRIGRERAERKMATPEKLKIRARKQAIKMLKKRVAGQKGVNYKELSPAEKTMIDKKLANKKNVIDRIARRMLPKVRKMERERKMNKNKQSSQQEWVHFNDNKELYEVMDYIAKAETSNQFSYNDYLEEKVLEWGTKELVDAYKKDTPGQNRKIIDKLKKHITKKPKV